MEIISVKYAESVLRESMVFKNGDNDKFRHIDFKLYLIQTNEKNILVDAGCETMPGFDMKNFIGPVKALGNINISTDDITDVIITHSHHDHIECVKYFDKAVVHIQSEELKHGKKYIPENFKLNIFDNEFSVCENVKIIKIGGHSEGSCIVEVKNNGTTYIICGDECYSRECLEKKIPTGSSVNSQKSKEFIERYSSDKYTVLLCHN